MSQITSHGGKVRPGATADIKNGVGSVMPDHEKKRGDEERRKSDKWDSRHPNHQKDHVETWRRGGRWNTDKPQRSKNMAPEG